MNPPASRQRCGSRIAQRDGLLSQETWIWLTQGGPGLLSRSTCRHNVTAIAFHVASGSLERLALELRACLDVHPRMA